MVTSATKERDQGTKTQGQGQADAESRRRRLRANVEVKFINIHQNIDPLRTSHRTEAQRAIAEPINPMPHNANNQISMFRNENSNFVSSVYPPDIFSNRQYLRKLPTTPQRRGDVR